VVRNITHRAASPSLFELILKQNPCLHQLDLPALYVSDTAKGPKTSAFSSRRQSLLGSGGLFGVWGADGGEEVPEEEESIVLAPVSLSGQSMPTIRPGIVHRLDKGTTGRTLPSYRPPNTLKTGLFFCSTVQYSTVQYSTVQYSTVQYSTVQYSTVQYSALHCCIRFKKFDDQYSTFNGGLKTLQ
jgi:hypothetical protein